MFILGASSLDNARDAPNNLKRKFRRYLFVVRGFLTLQPKIIKVGTFLRATQWQTKLNSHFHDSSKNSTSHQSSKKVGKLEVRELAEKLNQLKHRIAAIVYLQCLGTPNVLHELQSVKINKTKHLS